MPESLLTLPTQLVHLADRKHTRITLGKSDAEVWRIEDDSEVLFLKVEPIHPLAELPGEAERLRWLATQSVPAPELRDIVAVDGFNWLLMTALPGNDLTQMVDRPSELITTLATALRSLHAIDPATCPFDHRLHLRLEAGAANAAAGRVDESDFEDIHDGWTAAEVLAWLRAHQPQTSDLVVTHGDTSLPNIMAQHGRFSGIIDVGRLGLADRWQDLAIACRSVIFNCGQEHVAPFLEAYGANWDAERYAYYNALDELF